MKKRALVPYLFENSIVSNMVAPIGRRDAVRKLLFGSGVAALIPLLEKALGVEDVVCLAICAAAVAVICAYGNISCDNFCASYC